MAEFADAEARLRARLGDTAPAEDSPRPRTWNPRGGDADALIGRLLEVQMAKTRYGDAQVATLEDSDGEAWAVWLTAKTIASAWDTAEPQAGEIVAVQFMGERETRDGQRRYPVFAVAVDRPGAGSTPSERWGDAPPW